MEKSDKLTADGLVLFSLVAAVDILADQLSKAWIRSNVPVGEVHFEVGFFRIIDIRNTGAAFGIFQGFTPVLAVLSIVAAVTIILFAFFARHRFSFLRTNLGRFTLGLILGGIVGNMIDRLRLGYVTDFLDFTYWPVFNVSDASVVIGIILLAYLMLFRYKD